MERWPRAATAIVPLFLLLVLYFHGTAQAAPAGQRAPRVDVAVSGVDDELRDTVLAGLSLYREHEHPLLTDHRVRQLHRRAPDEIRATLQVFGFYEPRIDASLEQENGEWRARYAIEKGEPVRVGEVNLRITGEGADDDWAGEWRTGFPLERGEVFRQQLYSQAKQALLEEAQQRGYFDAGLKRHQVRVDVATDRAAIDLELDTGPRYRFGELRLADVPLRRELLAAFAPFQAGDPYNADQLYRFQRALSDSDYFSLVDVQPLREAAEGRQVPIQVDLAMRDRSLYKYGIGYGTDTGPRITLGYELRWLNSRGHRLAAEASASDIHTGVEVSYRMPLRGPASDSLAITAAHEEDETDTSFSRTTAIGAAVIHQLENWQRTIALKFAEEDYRVADESRHSRMLVPSVAWHRVKADDRIFPREGWKATLAVRAATEGVVSSTDLLQGELRAKYLTGLGPGRLITRLDLARSETPDFDSVPVSYRYFAGGDQSVRGFAYESLGPTNAEGDVLGGHNLFVASVEYDWYFRDKIGVAAFYDTGNAYNNDLDLESGAGLGLRYRLPFGVARLDVARTLSEPENDWRIHFSLSPDL